MSFFDRRTRPSGSAARGRATLDITDALDRLEAELKSDPPERRRAEILAIVGRWRWDPMIRDACQRRARALYDGARTSA